MTDTRRPPADGYRAISWPTELREDAGTAPRMTGHFARYGVFNEINSAIEGRFLERIADGAFKKTFAENRDRIRFLFQHGKDPQLGEQPIGAITELRSDNVGPYFEADLLDGVPPLVVDGLRRGVYGVSYRFAVTREDYEPKPAKSPANPHGLPERTIREARVFEFGPVTFPADPGADVSVRSLTDQMRPSDLPPVAPSDDAAAQPHLAPERRPEPAPIVLTRSSKESQVDISKYRTLDEMGARVRELDAEISRQAQVPGVLPESEQVDFDGKVAERAKLESAMTSWKARLAQVRESAESEGNVEPTYQPVASFSRKAETDIYDPENLSPFRYRSEDQFRTALRDNAMRSIETSRFPAPGADQDSARSDIATLLDHKDSPESELAQRIVITGSPLYRRAFNKLVKGETLTPEEQRAAALQVVGTTTTGGYAVPYQFDPTLIHTGAYTSINPFRAACRVEQLVGANVWQGVSVGAITAAYAAESAANTEGGPTFSNPSFTVRRAQAYVTLSFETMQDRSDISAELASLFGEAKDTLEENKFAVGAGAPAPAGMFVKGNFTVKETITNDTFAVGDLAATEGALPLRHRMNAAWFFSRAVIRTIQGWETAYGQLFNSQLGYPNAGTLGTNPTGNTGLRLLGYPVWESPSCPTTVTQDDAIVGILVDPRNYIIVDRVGMNIEVIPNMLDATTGLPTGDRGVLAIWRNTGGVLNADAGRQVNIN